MMLCQCRNGDACDICGGKISVFQLMDRVRRITASDPDNVWCRQATILLDAALKDN